jgi:hypothetical protein
LTKGTVQGRQVDSPNGLKWLVSLSNVKEVAAQKALGLDRVTPHSPAATTDDQPDHPGQMLVPRQDWERAIAQIASFADLAGELGEAKEAKGRAEVKAELFKEKLTEERERYQVEQERTRKHVEQLDSELQAAQEAAQRKRGWFRRRK